MDIPQENESGLAPVTADSEAWLDCVPFREEADYWTGAGHLHTYQNLSADFQGSCYMSAGPSSVKHSVGRTA